MAFKALSIDKIKKDGSHYSNLILILPKAINISKSINM
jgi:hypothetical protein